MHESSANADQKALAAVAAQFFINGALFASFIPRLPEIRDRVDISIAEVGLLISIAGATGLVGSATVGTAITRFGSRRVMMATGSLVAMALPLIGFATSRLVLLAALAAMFLFDVFVDVGMNMQGSWLSERRHTPVMNRLHGLWSLGTVVGGLSSARLASTGVSLSTHLLFAGAILLVTLGIISRWLLRVDEQRSESVQHSDRRQMNMALVLFGLAGFFALAIEATSSDWAAFRFVDDLGQSAGFGALGFVAVTAGMTSGRFLGDWVLVRLGAARLTMAAVALSGLGLTTASFSSSRHLVLVGYLGAGLGTATFLPMVYDAAVKHVGRPGVGLGALSAGIRAASLVIPLSIGTLASSSLGVGAAVAIVTLPSAVGFLVMSIALNRTNAGPSKSQLSDSGAPG